MEFKDFLVSYKQISERAIFISEKARREGLLNLEECINIDKEKKRDIFELGLIFIINGTDASEIDKILSNIINQEKDEYLRILKTIQKDAILAIQEGSNALVLKYIINSHTHLTYEEDEIFKDVDF